MDSTEKRSIYLDHAASTPVDPGVVEAMLPYFTETYGNASGLHSQARASARALDAARRDVAEVLGCSPKEVIFTSGGSESDNMAIRGVAWAQKQAGKGAHIITSPIEHSAVQKTIDQLCARFGFEQTRVPVDETGRVDPAAVAGAIRPDTVLISVMGANNEVGTIQPLAEIGQIARERGIPFHSDTVQAVNAIELQVDALNLDLLSLSAHKFYGPKGVGVLYLRQGTPFLPPGTGGGHEGNRRPGTENIPYIVGLARALRLVERLRPGETLRQAALRDRLVAGVLQAVPGAQLTGHPTQRLPNNASFVFPGCDASALLMHLDMQGIAAASGSACDTGMPEPSAVLLAMGVPSDLALGALRLTLGRSTTGDDIDYVLDVLPKIVS
ncbi:MAG: cysteine desulfurase family protein, partial [Anaerolineae bacterium]